MDTRVGLLPICRMGERRWQASGHKLVIAISQLVQRKTERRASWSLTRWRSLELAQRLELLVLLITRGIELQSKPTRTTPHSVSGRYRFSRRAVAAKPASQTYWESDSAVRYGCRAELWGGACGGKSRGFHSQTENLSEGDNETGIWLRILQGSVAISPDFVNRLVAENTELCKILVASVQTALRNDSMKAMGIKGEEAGFD